MNKNLKYKLKKSKLYILVKIYRGIIENIKIIFYPVTLKRAKIKKSIPTETGVTDKLYNNKNVIVSLTSFPERIKYVYKTVYSLMHQSVKPNMIIIWLSKKQFPQKEDMLPDELLDLQKMGLTIEWLEDDWKPYKKIIPSLIKYPDEIIVTADDDLYYPTFWLESLLKSYNKYPNEIHCHLITRVDYDGINVSFKNRYFTKSNCESSFNNKILGGSGTLYPPRTLYKDVTNSLLFMSLAPTNDDIWLWAMALKNGTKIRWIENNMPTLYWVEGSQENTPCLVNENNYGENKRLIQMIEVFNKYDLLDFLLEKNTKGGYKE